MTFNISEKQASLCRVGPVILWLWLCSGSVRCLKNQMPQFSCFIDTPMFSSLSSSNTNWTSLQQQQRRFFALRVTDGLYASKRFGQGRTHPGRPVALATNFFFVVAHNIFSIITAFNFSLQNVCVNRASSVGIATRYGLDGSGIEFRWGEVFCPSPHTPWGPTQLPVQWRSDFFSGGKSWRWPPIQI